MKSELTLFQSSVDPIIIYSIELVNHYWIKVMFVGKDLCEIAIILGL